MVKRIVLIIIAGKLKEQTEGLILTAQGQALRTNLYKWEDSRTQQVPPGPHG